MHSFESRFWIHFSSDCEDSMISLITINVLNIEVPTYLCKINNKYVLTIGLKTFDTEPVLKIQWFPEPQTSDTTNWPSLGPE